MPCLAPLGGRKAPCRHHRKPGPIGQPSRKSPVTARLDALHVAVVSAGVDGLAVWGATFLDCATEAERSLQLKEARADGVVSFLSRREATAPRAPERTNGSWELRRVEEAAPGQLRSLGTDAFTASRPETELKLVAREGEGGGESRVRDRSMS